MKKTPTKTKRPSPRKLSDAAWNDVRSAYLCGGTLRGLAREAGISENTILVRAHREKWSQQRQAALAKILPQKSHEESLGISHGRLMERHLLNMMAVSERLSDFANALPVEMAWEGVSKIDTMDRFTRRQLGLDKPEPVVSVNLFGGSCAFDDVSSVFEAVTNGSDKSDYE